MIDVQPSSLSHGAARLSEDAAFILGALFYAPEIQWLSPNILSISCEHRGIERLLASKLVEIVTLDVTKDPIETQLPVKLKLSAGLARLMRDRHGRPIQGVPPVVMRSSGRTAAAVISGALSSAGCAPHGREWSISCPNHVRALALAGLLHRCSVQSRIGASGARTVFVGADEKVTLEQLGLSLPALIFPAAIERPMDYEPLVEVNRARRSEGVDKIRWAMAILGDGVRKELAEIAQLRLEHPDVSLEQLGQMLNPPATRHAVAGLLRRLHAAAVNAAAGSDLS